MKTPPSKTILCGTDFSENASGAALAAAGLARISGKNLTLVHVADSMETGVESADSDSSVQRRLHAEASRLAGTGVLVSGELLQGGSAGQAILDQVALRPEVDLIVVSSVSKTAIDRWTLGSVSERLSEVAAVATLVVRQPGVIADWAAGKRPLKVFVAADFSTSARTALRWAGDLRKLGPCQLTAAYVNWPPAERKRLGARGPMELTANSAEIQHVLERDFREMAGREFGAGEFEIIVQPGWGRADAHLVNLAIETGADLLVVGTRQREGFERWHKGSVSRGILRHAPMNVACVPVKTKAGPAIVPCRRVLAPVDLEKADAFTLPGAYSIVNEEGTVFLLNVERPVRPPNPLIGGMPGKVSSKRESAQKLSETRALLRKMIPPETGGIRTEVQVLESDDVVQAICEAAEMCNADIVCMGANTRPGVVARVMGSVTLGVLQKCRRPVLVVWPEK